MKLQRYGVGGHKDAVAFEKVQHLAFSEQGSASVDAQEHLEGIAVRPKVRRYADSARNEMPL